MVPKARTQSQLCVTHDNMLGGEVFEVWEDEGVAVRRLQDLISLDLELR